LGWQLGYIESYLEFLIDKQNPLPRNQKLPAISKVQIPLQSKKRQLSPSSKPFYPENFSTIKHLKA